LKKQPYNVGGQAVIEGVMMRSPNCYAVAVRRMNGKIVTESGEVKSITKKAPFMKWPFLRGSVSLYESMALSFSTLDFSSRIALQDEEAAERKKKGKKFKKRSKATEDLIQNTLMVVSFAIALLLFVYAPVKFVKWLGTKQEILAQNTFWFNLTVVCIRFALFFLYVWAISFMNDVKRLFQYHGAEHKVIYAFEDGKKVTQKSVKPYRTEHPRCGTAFMFLTFVISLVLFIIFLPPHLSIPVRLLIELPLIIPIAGISYEILRLSGKYRDNWFLKAFTAPGIWFQQITTKEPDAKQIQVAMKALQIVLAAEKKAAKKKK
jgi:uncharacterized protein YqhQ